MWIYIMCPASNSTCADVALHGFVQSQVVKVYSDGQVGCRQVIITIGNIHFEIGIGGDCLAQGFGNVYILIFELA